MGCIYDGPCSGCQWSKGLDRTGLWRWIVGNEILDQLCLFLGRSIEVCECVQGIQKNGFGRSGLFLLWTLKRGLQSRRWVYQQGQQQNTEPTQALCPFLERRVYHGKIVLLDMISMQGICIRGQDI